MRSTVLWTLAVLNVVLLVVFIARITPDNTARAQAQGQAVRRSGEYVMIPGEVSGGRVPSVVYIVDESGGQLSAVAFDESRGLETMSPMDLQAPAAGAPGTGSGTGTGTRTGTGMGTPRRGY